MEKNGFTVAELVSVVFVTLIVLTIGISVIYNNIDEMNRNIIVDETKRLYEKAEERYKDGTTYRVVSSKDSTKLNGFFEDLQYCIYLSDEGKVVSIKTSYKNYLITLNDNPNIKDLSKDDLQKGNLDNYECE